MLIFNNWLKEKHQLVLEDILVAQIYKKYVDEYIEYEKTFELTMNYEEALSFLKEHSLFQRRFDECIYMLGKDKGKELILEVDVFVLDEKENRLMKYHSFEYDVHGDNYEHAIIKLAHKVLTNFNYERN